MNRDRTFFYTRGGCVSCLHACLGTRLLPQSHQYPDLSEGTDGVGGQLRGDEECPFSGVTKSGRVWRKVPESDARSVTQQLTRLGERGEKGRKAARGRVDRRGGEEIQVRPSCHYGTFSTAQSLRPSCHYSRRLEPSLNAACLMAQLMSVLRVTSWAEINSRRFQLHFDFHQCW